MQTKVAPYWPDLRSPKRSEERFMRYYRSFAGGEWRLNGHRRVGASGRILASMRGATRPPCSNSPGAAGAFPFPSPFEHVTRIVGEFTARFPSELARVAPDRTWATSPTQRWSRR